MCSEFDSTVKIHFEGEIDGDRLIDVQELVTLIDSNPGIEAQNVLQESPEGAKPALTSTLAVIGAVTGVAGLVMQAITIWKQDKPRYSITITESDRTYTVDNLSPKDYLATVRRLNSNHRDVSPTFSIKKNHV